MTEQILFRVIDTETSGLDGPDHHDLVEIGWTDLFFHPEDKACRITRPQSELFYAPRGIPTDAQAIHHILPEDVVNKAPFTSAAGRRIMLAENEGLKPMFFVAHNADFDRQWLTVEITDGTLWIDTFKAAVRLIPQAKSHGNQFLRYELGLGVDRALAEPPHRAASDSFVTAHILAHLIGLADSIAQLELFTRMPRFYPVCPLKKHKGQAWGDIPASYLDWMIRQGEMERDLRLAAQDELDLRREEAAEAARARMSPSAPQDEPA